MINREQQHKAFESEYIGWVNVAGRTMHNKKRFVFLFLVLIWRLVRNQLFILWLCEDGSCAQ